MSNLWDKLSAGLDLGTFGLEIKNWRDIARLSGLARGGISSFLSKKSTGSEGNSGPTDVAENAMQAGELQSFLGYLSAVHSDDGKKITEYQVGTREHDLYPAIVAAMKPGARKLLMQTLGVQTIPVRKRRVVGYSEHEVNGKVVRSPDTEETTEVVNLAGPQITSALTWLATQGGGTKEARVKHVVGMLDTFGLFHSKQDALKELGEKGVKEAKLFKGWLATHVHVFGAMLTLGPKRLQAFLETPECERLLAAIEAKRTPATKRPLQERFQADLVAESQRVNASEKEAYQAFAKRNWKIAVWLLGGLFLLIEILKHM